MTLTLPPGETLDGYGAISLWCAAFFDQLLVGVIPVAWRRPYERAGWVAQLPSGPHQVQGKATIITERIIRVENFTYDGTAPLVFFYLGGNNTYQAFLNGIAIGPELDHAFNNETVVVALPEGDTLDPYTAISVWCAEFSTSTSVRRSSNSTPRRITTTTATSTSMISKSWSIAWPAQAPRRIPA